MDNVYDFTFQALTVAFAVDTFFLITGFLVVYLSLKKMPLGGVKKFPWIHFYLCRVWRTSPTFYVVFLVYWLLWPNVSSGPMWGWDNVAAKCPKVWWQTMLYFNNYYGLDTYSCFGSSWYLAVDLQLFIFSPIFIILFYLKPKAGLIASGITILASAVYCAVVAIVGQINLPLMFGPIKPSAHEFLLNHMHYYPFAHVAPFAIGMLTGYLVYKYRDTIKLTKWQTIMGWSLFLAIFPLATYGPIFDGPIDDRVRQYNALSPFYSAVCKPVWALCVAWVIFACAIGKGGVINKFLSWSPFIVLGRLTFAAYLIHINMLHVYYHPKRTLVHLSDIEMIFTGAGMIAMSFAGAFVLAVCVELPSYALPKIMLKGRKI